MTENTAAPAPVAEEVLSDAAPENTPEPTEDDILAEVWESNHAPETPEEGEEAPEGEGEGEEASTEPETALEPAPKELPAPIRDEWEKLTPRARDAITASYREQNNRLAEQGRKIQAIDPIYQQIVEAQKSIPGLGNRTPQQLGQELLHLAQFQANFQKDPVNQAVSFLQNAGLVDAMRAKLGGGDQSTAQLHAELAGLRKELAQRNDPNAAYEQYRQFSMQERTVSDVETYAKNAEHWATVEPILPAFVEAAKTALGESASPSDVLDTAYNMAVQAKGLPAKAKDAPASPRPDPAKAEQVKKATSVNLTGSPSGNPRVLSEDEEYAEAYRRAVNR